MKRGSKLLLAVTLTFVMAFGAVACVDSGGGTPTPPTPPVIVDPPVPVSEVESVTIVYDGQKVTGGVLSVDLTVGSIVLSAEVRKTEDADGTVSFTSSDTAVAEIDAASGKVTLKQKGETVISASAGAKKHEIVLVVTDDYTMPQQYTITVIGGTADKNAAIEGEHIS
jgi:outer membrane lipoprotein-sorting protein